MFSQKTIALVILLCGLIGLTDSFYLVVQYFNALTSNGAPTPCSPNSLISCTKTVQGEWAHLLGVSNPLFGLLWYGMFSFYGFSRYVGSTYTSCARKTVAVLSVLGLLFSYTLYLASVTVLRGVCPFCLLSTVLSTIVVLAFVLDDRTYTDAIITDKIKPFIYGFQIFAVATFCIGLIIFLSYFIPLLVQPISAITHWSFPVILLLIASMAGGNWWVYKGLQQEVPQLPVVKTGWFTRMFRRS